MSEIKNNAQRVFEYIYNTKVALNFGALFADGTEFYRTPAEVDLGGTVRLRFRTEVDNVDAVYIICNDERHEMTIESSDNLFDYYVYTISEVK